MASVGDILRAVRHGWDTKSKPRNGFGAEEEGRYRRTGSDAPFPQDGGRAGERLRNLENN